MQHCQTGASKLHLYRGFLSSCGHPQGSHCTRSGRERSVPQSWQHRADADGTLLLPGVTPHYTGTNTRSRLSAACLGHLLIADCHAVVLRCGQRLLCDGILE